MSGHDHHGHHHDHADHEPPVAPTPVAEERRPKGDASRSPAHDHAGMDHSTMDHSAMDHSTMDHADHPVAHNGGHSHHDPAQYLRLFWWSLALTIPTLVFSTGLQEILGLPGPRFPGSEYIPAVFGIAVFAVGGWVFLKGAWSELRNRAPGMMTLISLALLVALGYSLAVTFGLEGMDFWWELSTLTTIMLLGHWIELSAVQGAQNALGELAKLLPDEADLINEGHLTAVPVARLQVGDLVAVRSGAAVPADGVVTEGESQTDEALLTGESAPVPKTVGDSVVAGSINIGNPLAVRITKIGSDTALAGIARLVADAQASRSPVQLLADRAAALLFYVALGAAAITLVAWSLISPDDPAFIAERVVTVLVIACPHALGLAIPLVALLSTSIGARHGILVRSREALEEAREADVVLFDKTGTLTEGRQAVVRVVAVEGQDEDAVLALAASVESRSEHPIARAIVAANKERATKSAGRATGFGTLAGRGATAKVAERVLTVASSRLVTERGIRLDSALVHATNEVAKEGATVVYLLETDADGTDRALAMFALADVVRPESVEAVSALQKRGVRVALLTGDSHGVAAYVGAQLGIREVFAEVLPGEKSEVVARLQKDGAKVVMVGDGINDAPALARADVGIAIGAGTDVAIESAGVVLASNDPRGVVDTITLSRASYRKMLQNLGWATGYNVIAIPLAAGVLAGAGILLSPWVGALLMSVSTVVVALNAQLLRRIRLSHR